jgi:hypothetical protein
MATSVDISSRCVPSEMLPNAQGALARKVYVVVRIDPPMRWMLLVYGSFTAPFYWLVFRHTGITVNKKNDTDPSK